MEKAEMGGFEISIAKQVQVYYVGSTFHFWSEYWQFTFYFIFWMDYTSFVSFLNCLFELFMFYPLCLVVLS